MKKFLFILSVYSVTCWQRLLLPPKLGIRPILGTSALVNVNNVCHFITFQLRKRR